MEKALSHPPEPHLRSILTLEPLLNFWAENIVPQCAHMADAFDAICRQMKETPSLTAPIQDIPGLMKHPEILQPLMGVIFPKASFDTDIMAAFSPCGLEPFYATTRFRQLFLNLDGGLNSCIQERMVQRTDHHHLTLYHLILDRIYDIPFQDANAHTIETIPDKETSLDRHYRICPDFRFLEVHALGTPPKLSESQKAEILDQLTDPHVLGRHIDLDAFEFRGFTVTRAMDVTDSQVISELEREMLNQGSIFSNQGISTLEAQLQVLFKRPDLTLGIGALRRDKILLIKNDCKTNVTCLYTNSMHIPMADLEDTIWMRATRGTEIVRISDLAALDGAGPLELNAAESGIRSLLLAPLYFEDQGIGLMELFSSEPGDFGPMDALKLKQLIPLFSVAVKRGLDELDKQVQSVIKEKCTAVHPSVEWRFEDTAMEHMEQSHNHETAPMAPIIFNDVVPFYGQSDIRGSSHARNRGIQQDLIRQLGQADRVLKSGQLQRPWPLLKEYRSRIHSLSQAIETGITSGHETAVHELLNREMASTFEELSTLGGEMARDIAAYKAALDPATGMVYDKRREYEHSVSQLNQALSNYLEAEDSLTQQTFPHYFEKRQTDGVDYMMYIGASMNRSQTLSGFHIKNMTLWQIMVACGLALETHKVTPRLAIPLETCHLILVNHTPLSIRFRYDEKRFDVDGAYDVRHEIIKSRLDKALVKGTGERLTQPDQVAIVYSTPSEGREIRHHLDFLTQLGRLHPDREKLELEDMPDVRGLKALRVSVNIEALEAIAAPKGETP